MAPEPTTARQTVTLDLSMCPCCAGTPCECCRKGIRSVVFSGVSNSSPPDCDCSYYNDTEFLLDPGAGGCDVGETFPSDCDTPINIEAIAGCVPPVDEGHGPVGGMMSVTVTVRRVSPFLPLAEFEKTVPWDGISEMDCLLKDIPCVSGTVGHCDWTGATASVS